MHIVYDLSVFNSTSNLDNNQQITKVPDIVKRIYYELFNRWQVKLLTLIKIFN